MDARRILLSDEQLETIEAAVPPELVAGERFTSSAGFGSTWMYNL